MTKKRDKKRTPTWLFTAIILMMFIVFVIQLLFPTNLSKFLNENLVEATEITVTVASNDEETASYYTDSVEDMFNLIEWAGDYKMSNKSIADTLTPDANLITKYNFAIKNADGSYVGIVIDVKGFVHTGAEVYKIRGDEEQFIKELVEELESWKKAN